MKRAGELLSALFDEGFMKKAQGYSNLFSAWQKITAKCGIAAAADHSRIRELERCVLLIEADHPGWVQLLQTKQHRLLSDARRRFPDLTITGISFMLSREPPGAEKAPEPAAEVTAGQEEAVVRPQEPLEPGPAATGQPEINAGTVNRGSPSEAAEQPAAGEAGAAGADPYAKITDEGLRDTLKRLEQGLKGK
ncbi:hypothetical protein AGMMS49546_15240 [Spirochaetia bacterium]|nr:hypothetical protein AGMMS49546_15240 [Spirochaetia bacterium]